MEYVTEIALNFWETFREMAPYLVFGFIFAGILSVFINPDFIERHLGGSGTSPIVKASLFGVPLPLCSCSVIPVATSLRRHGSSKAATTSFLLSTPQTGVDSILVTFSLLGPVFAIFRPIAAFLTGMIGGSIINVFGTETAEGDAEDENCACSCENQKKESKFRKAIRHGFITLPRDIGRPLLIGVLIAGAIGAFVPETFFADYLGTGFLAMIVMMLLGIPIYVCATASIPIAAAMIMKGVTPGAALVFLMTGPATNAATFGAIWKILGRRETFIYLAVVAITALACGVILDLLFVITELPAGSDAVTMLPGWLKNGAAILLAAILAYATLPQRNQDSEAD